VVVVRFHGSNMVYQGFGQGADRARIAALSAMLGCDPDMTVVLDVPVSVSVARLAQRGTAADRYERLGADFFARVQEGFRRVAQDNPRRCVLVEATSDASTTAAAVWAAVCRLMESG
jgi:dTMP kinase